MPSDFVIVSAFCYRRHGFLPEAVVPKVQVRGEWVICPRCALGADPDPMCMNEVHWAWIVPDGAATRAEASRFAPLKVREKVGRKMDVPSMKVRGGGKTLEDDRERDRLLHDAETEARRRGYADVDALYADLARVERIKQRYEARIRATSGP